MAKKITKKKEVKVPEVKATKRGRPSATNTIEKTIKKEAGEEVYVDSSKNDFIIKIYGEEKEKSYNPFPKSDLQTQTKNIIKEYSIIVSLLPQEIVNAINNLVNDFSAFVSNPNQFNMIGGIMDKDLVAVNMIKDWMKDKKELLLEYKKQNPDSEKEEEIKVLPPVTINNGIPSQNSPSQSPHFMGSSNENHLNNEFTPRPPVSTYQHNINNAPHSENKDIHYQVLSEAYPSIIAQNTAQQNWGSNSQVEQTPVDYNKVFEDFCQTVYDTIMGCFQIRFWGYIPQSEVKNIISRSDAMYQYKFVLDGDKSFIEITWNDKTHRTKFFNAQ